MTPAAKFSITTSALATSSRKISLPRGCLRSSTTDSLLEFSMTSG